jgi:hypothetical protein
VDAVLGKEVAMATTDNPRLARESVPFRVRTADGETVDFSESHNFAIAGLHCATLELQRDQ